MTSSAQSASSTVLIIGAGPTGLLAANLLTRLGVPCRIIEKRPSLGKESRALGIQARSLEQLMMMGLADQFLDNGVLASGIRVNVNGKEVLAVDYGKVAVAGGPFEFPLTIEQNISESIIFKDLESRGGTIEFNTEAIEIDVEEPSRVCVTLRRNVNSAGGDLGDQSKDQSTTEKANFAYVIGADGAHSLVRKTLKLTFEGAAYGQNFLLTDCLVENWPHTGTQFRMFISGTQLAIHFPLKEAGRARIVIVLSKPMESQENGRPSGENLKRVDTADSGAIGDGGHGVQQPATKAIDEAALLSKAEALFRETTGLGDAIAFKDARWVSEYRVHRRHANKYRLGRVFVAGDAAHIHSPAAGQGMNTGMQDVANLAWKLACVVKGGASDELLDSYHSERWPVGQKVAQGTDRIFNYLATDKAVLAALRNFALSWIVPTVTRGAAAKNAGYHFMSQLAIRYHLGQFVVDEDVKEGKNPKEFRAGWRAPDGHINRKLSVFDLLTAQTFTLLLLKRSSMSENEIAATTNLIKAKIPATLGGIEMKSYLICRSSIGRDPRILQAETMDVFDAYRMDSDKSEAVILIRPDGYIAYHSAALNIDNLVPFLARFQAVKEQEQDDKQQVSTPTSVATTAQD